MSRESKRPQRQEAFIAALLAHSTVAQAAKAIGISEPTATRWLRNPGFKEAYAEARRRMLDEAMRYLQSTMLAATTTLRGVMLSDTTKPAQKIMAARTILELGLRTYELQELEERIARLEAAQGAQR